MVVAKRTPKLLHNPTCTEQFLGASSNLNCGMWFRGTEIWMGNCCYYQLKAWTIVKCGLHELKFGVGTIIGFFRASFGSVGGVGSGGIFIPMLTPIIGFDTKSATAISKC